ncbi:MAG: TraR/DksA family transcriptional regulator [Candidatus Binatia bacterium]
MRKTFLKKTKQTLLETKKRLLREIRDRVKEETEGSKDEGRDAYDLASDERDREISFILNGRERAKLSAIEQTLQRIEDKTYGICECGCENCEGEIQLGRLKVLPFTRLCVKCQEETERESRHQKRSDEERGYRKLAITDIEEDNF